MHNEDWELTCVQARFKRLLCKSQWTDCTFRVGHENVEVIHSHKLVLAVSSPVFEALFFGPLANSDEKVISVPDIEPHTFRAFLHYLYSDEFKFNGIEETGDLLYAAKKYLVRPLSSLCISDLVQHTWIKTLWDILYIAESLNEDKLLSACMKVMSRYRYEIWGCESENLSGSALRRLLEQHEMNMSELELWNLVLDWARKELDARDIVDSLDARRAVIEKAGIFSRMRFLTIPESDLDQLVGVITKEEVDSFRAKKDVPSIFSKTESARSRVTPMFWRSGRNIVNNRNCLWINRGEAVCSICTTSRVLVVGFEVFTRLMLATSLIKTPANSSYREKLTIFIKDSDDNIIQKTDYNNVVSFNTTQNINLVRPIWFEPNIRYTVNIAFIKGQYPICKYNDGTCRGTEFFFEEAILVENTDKIPSSFILSVLYAL